LEDLDPERAKCLTQHIKHWADPWGKMGGETKGGLVPLPYDIFIVTSQYSIEETFTDPKDYAAIKRRFKQTKILSYDMIFKDPLV